MTCAQGLLRLLWGGAEVGVLRDWRLGFVQSVELFTTSRPEVTHHYCRGLKYRFNQRIAVKAVIGKKVLLFCKKVCFCTVKLLQLQAPYQ